ncbi:hypothetical protein FB451DRAFT_1414907 [Mycena latifolia]|nr:hypothetical protein FB451DRAFT_1414907 [Mycena latifolia]
MTIPPPKSLAIGFFASLITSRALDTALEDSIGPRAYVDAHGGCGLRRYSPPHAHGRQTTSMGWSADMRSGGITPDLDEGR